MRKGLGRSSIGLALMLPLSALAASSPPGADGNTPVASVMVSGISCGYVVRFGGPVDHVFSQLQITQNGRTLETLPVRLESAPNVLFARGRTLPPGTYDLHWKVKSMTDSNVSEGDASFTVEPQHD
jgi:methionine-rich copper-binding protein CopC